ncbi:MAG: hypothetical protein AAF927_12045 [Bacteroidota bacterium]
MILIRYKYTILFQKYNNRLVDLCQYREWLLRRTLISMRRGNALSQYQNQPVILRSLERKIGVIPLRGTPES